MPPEDIHAVIWIWLRWFEESWLNSIKCSYSYLCGFKWNWSLNYVYMYGFICKKLYKRHIKINHGPHVLEQLIITLYLTVALYDRSPYYNLVMYCNPIFYSNITKNAPFGSNLKLTDIRLIKRAWIWIVTNREHVCTMPRPFLSLQILLETHCS